MALETYKADTLTLELREEEGAVYVVWTGRSTGRDPGPFIGMKATLDLDSEAYTWTEIPPPDSEFWETWKEGDPVIWVREKLLSSRYAA